MEIKNFKDNMKVFYITADSFSACINAANQKRCPMFPATVSRKFSGISHPGISGGIIYKAAGEESFSGETEKLGCKTFLIKKDEYLSETLNVRQKNEGIIADTFRKLRGVPRLDKNR